MVKIVKSTKKQCENSKNWFSKTLRTQYFEQMLRRGHWVTEGTLEFLIFYKKKKCSADKYIVFLGGINDISWKKILNIVWFTVWLKSGCELALRRGQNFGPPFKTTSRIKICYAYWFLATYSLSQIYRDYKKGVI